MTYVIALPCVDVKDRACVDECPVDCIYEGERSLYIHPDECVDCGACEPVCPVEAIYCEDDLPEQWAGYYRANVDFFEEIGSPGGAARTGVLLSTTRWSRRCPRRPDQSTLAGLQCRHDRCWVRCKRVQQCGGTDHCLCRGL